MSISDAGLIRIFDLLDLSSFADALVIEADRKLASSEPCLVVMIERCQRLDPGSIPGRRTSY